MKNTRSNIRIRQLAKAYLIVKESLIQKGYADELDWQYSVSLPDLNEQSFLRESAWVILCSGFHETILRRIFPKISISFFDWNSAHVIIKNAVKCREEALRHFNHKRKIDAIISIASHINGEGFTKILNNIIQQGVSYLQQFIYIGPVTACHLAKNIGFPISKADRHLIRLAQVIGYGDVHQLCLDISDAISEPIAVVDLVLWRYLALNKRNINRFTGLIGRC